MNNNDTHALKYRIYSEVVPSHDESGEIVKNIGQ